MPNVSRQLSEKSISRNHTETFNAGKLIDKIIRSGGKDLNAIKAVIDEYASKKTTASLDALVEIYKRWPITVESQINLNTNIKNKSEKTKLKNDIIWLSKETLIGTNGPRIKDLMRSDVREISETLRHDKRNLVPAFKVLILNLYFKNGDNKSAAANEIKFIYQEAVRLAKEEKNSQLLTTLESAARSMVRIDHGYRGKSEDFIHYIISKRCTIVSSSMSISNNIRKTSDDYVNRSGKFNEAEQKDIINKNEHSTFVSRENEYQKVTSERGITESSDLVIHEPETDPINTIWTKFMFPDQLKEEIIKYNGNLNLIELLVNLYLSEIYKSDLADEQVISAMVKIYNLYSDEVVFIFDKILANIDDVEFAIEELQEFNPNNSPVEEKSMETFPDISRESVDDVIIYNTGNPFFDKPDFEKAFDAIFPVLDRQ